MQIKASPRGIPLCSASIVKGYTAPGLLRSCGLGGWAVLLHLFIHLLPISPHLLVHFPSFLHTYSHTRFHFPLKMISWGRGVVVKKVLASFWFPLSPSSIFFSSTTPSYVYLQFVLHDTGDFNKLGLGLIRMVSVWCVCRWRNIFM